MVSNEFTLIIHVKFVRDRIVLQTKSLICDGYAGFCGIIAEALECESVVCVHLSQQFG